MVRLQNITWVSLRVVITLLISSYFFQTFAQNTPPPRPAVCDESGPTPLAGEFWGGDFEITVGSGGVTNNSYCLGPGENSVRMTFVQNNDPLLVGPFTTNVGYRFNVTDNSTLIGDYSSNTDTTYAEGYYWVAQTGTTGNGQTYHKCKLISVFKKQPVSASIVTCASSTVTVFIPPIADIPTNNHSKYSIDWGDNSPIETFDAPSGPDPLKIEKKFVPTSPIKVDGIYTDPTGNEVCRSNQPFLKLPDPANDVFISKVEKKSNLSDYEIEFKGFVPMTIYKVSYAVDDGNYAFVQDAGNHINGNAQISGLAPDENYCFKIAYVDNCGVAKETDTICSITLNANVVSDTDVDLEWNRPTLPLGILDANNLQKDEPGVSGQYEEPGLSSPTATTHTYDRLACSKNYTFQVLNRFTIQVAGVNQEVEILSNLINVDPSTTAQPPKPSFPAVVSYTDDATEVRFNVSVDRVKNKWNFYRLVGGAGSYTLIGTSPNNEFTDSNVFPNQEYYCYKYTYFDDCGNESEQSDAYCTIFLESSAPNQLNWTDYVVPDNVVTNSDAVRYQVLYIDKNGIVNVIANTSDLQQAIDNILNSSNNEAEFKFQIAAVQNATLSNGQPFTFRSLSNIFTFNLPSASFIPTAFTPNGDGINDIFKPELRFVQSGTMIIYDRWGSIIFETQDVVNEGWNGTEASGSRLAPTGTYTYKIQTISNDNTPSFYSGSVTLIR